MCQYQIILHMCQSEELPDWKVCYAAHLFYTTLRPSRSHEYPLRRLQSFQSGGVGHRINSCIPKAGPEKVHNTERSPTQKKLHNTENKSHTVTLFSLCLTP